MTDETTPAEGEAAPMPEPETPETAPEAPAEDAPPADGEGDPESENPPADAGDPAAPPDVAFSETEPNEPEADEVEPQGAVGTVGVTQIPEQEEGRGEVVAGEVEPNVLSSGDELPRHRQEVEGVG